jgi:outer membrane receptor for ferric coprogen and ferric-rhodotorulic acid
MFRDANRFIEDAPTVLPFSNFVYANLPAAERRYRALTFELNRLMANRWSATVSYSFSKYYGNLDIDYSGGLAGAQIFNTSSLLEDGPGSFVEDRFREGVLTQDRPHVLKVFATYMPEFLDGLTFSGYVRAQSGTPWEARGLPWGSTLTYLRYLEPAGTNRTDSWTNFDFLAAYRLKLPRNAGFKIEGRVLNLFNAETALLRDNRKYLDGRIRAFTSTPGPDCDRACYTDLMVQGTTQPNPAYGQPTAYATPRRFLLTLLVDF